MTGNLKIRKARTSDVKSVHGLIEKFAARGEMLPRSMMELYENLRDIFICTQEGGKVVGVSALHIMWEDLAEVRSLAVVEEFSGLGAGSMLLDACISEARALEISRIFALTYRPGFFERFGFYEVDKASLPQKIWGDCIKCSKFPDCDETAVIMNL